ncbi:MAG: DNA polymerase III subunit delta' [Gallionella sp.]
MRNTYPWQHQDWLRLREIRKRPPYGLLFTGAKGIGKFDLSINFAQSLLCRQPDEDDMPCGRCPSCHWFDQESHPDFRLIQPEALEAKAAPADSGKKPSKQISVDQIRALSDFVGMSAHQGGRRVVVIHPAESMNSNAANALLKSLEDAPEGLLFILVTHKSQQLLPTVRSRCISFSVSAPDHATAIAWLQAQGIERADAVLASTGYSPLEAVRPDQRVADEQRDKLLRAIRNPAEIDIFALADTLKNTEQMLVVHWMQQWSYDLTAIKLTGTLRYHPGEEATITKLVKSVDPLNLARLQKHLITAKREAQHTLNAKLFFESLLLVYSRLTAGSP